MVLVEQHYKDIRRKLDEMGYHQPCSIESILLVDRLLNDLICTRDKLILSEDVLSSTLNKCEQVEKALEIYKEENKHFLKENNRIHVDIIRSKEESDKKIKQLKLRISDLENMYSDLEFNYMEQMTNMGTIRQELLDKTNKLYELGIHMEDDELEKAKIMKLKYFKDDINKCSSEDSKNEIENYKKKHRQLLNEIEMLESQLQSRDKEIARLGNQLEQKKDYTKTAELKKCPCHLEKTSLPLSLQSTVEMNEKVKAAQDKQHEAMQRAITLADHIQEIEMELKELRRKKENSSQCTCGANITSLEKQLVKTLNKIKEIEIRITKLHSLIVNITKEKDEAKDKILNLKKEKDSLLDKLENFKIMEKDLTLEIDRLNQNNADMRNEMAHLVDKNNDMLDLLKKSPKTINENKSTMTKTQGEIRRANGNDSVCEKVKAERDYYCNELHRLQERVFSVERLHDLRCYGRKENEMDSTLIHKLQNDMRFANEENKRLQEEIITLRNQLKEVSKYKYDANKLVDNHIKKLESDNDLLTSTSRNLKSKVQNAEQNLEQMSKKVCMLTEELDSFKIKCNHIKKLNIQLEYSLKNSEAGLKRAEADLTRCMAKMNDLEKELKHAREQINIIKKEKQEVKENLLRLDNEKDELLLKMDEKTILLSKLDRDLHCKNSLIAHLENKQDELHTQIETVERMIHASDEKCRVYVQDNRKLEQENVSLQSCKKNLLLENQSLKRELEAVCQDNRLNNQTLEKYRKESDNLKRELQTYVDEVRRVETILLEKEREREVFLEQFNALSAEATHLESSHQSLECEANMSKDNLRVAQEKLFELQKDATARDSEMKTQVHHLSEQVIQLQAKVSEMSDRELIITSDLEAARNLCGTLEDQKQYYNKQLTKMEANEKILRDQLERLECENETLINQFGQEQKTCFAMEKMLSTSRQDAIEKCIFNEDLTKEVNEMRETVMALESKLNSVKLALNDCQSACSDYHAQNVQLKRELTNEKYERARVLDSNSTSL